MGTGESGVLESAAVGIAAIPTLYEAVALGIKAIASDPWTDEIAHGLNTVRVLAKAPQIEHTVQIQKFHRWLSERGTTPGEMTARAKIREILGVKSS